MVIKSDPYSLVFANFSRLFALNGISLILGPQVVKFLAGRLKEDTILLIGLLINPKASLVSTKSR